METNVASYVVDEAAAFYLVVLPPQDFVGILIDLLPEEKNARGAPCDECFAVEEDHLAQVVVSHFLKLEAFQIIRMFWKYGYQL